MTPQVTALITTIGHAGFLRRSLTSVSGQGIEVDVVVVDDASEHGVEATVDSAGGSDVQLVRSETRLGVSGARNLGISAATTPWIAFLDDDDVWAPGKVEGQLAVAGKADFVYTSLLAFDERSGSLRELPAPDPDGLDDALHVSNVIGTPSSVMVRRSALSEVGGFDESLSVLADWDLWLRLAADHRPARCKAALVGYVRHSTNMHHRRDPRELLGEFDRIASKHDSASGRSALDRPRYLRWIANGYRRSGRRRIAATSFLRAAAAGRQPRLCLSAAAALMGDPSWLAERNAAESIPAPAWLRPHLDAMAEQDSSARAES